MNLQPAPLQALHSCAYVSVMSMWFSSKISCQPASLHSAMIHHKEWELCYPLWSRAYALHPLISCWEELILIMKQKACGLFVSQTYTLAVSRTLTGLDYVSHQILLQRQTRLKGEGSGTGSATAAHAATPIGSGLRYSYSASIFNRCALEL